MGDVNAERAAAVEWLQGWASGLHGFPNRIAYCRTILDMLGIPLCAPQPVHRDMVKADL